jgi:hypothetical protein
MVQNITNYTFDYAAKQITLTGVTANVEKVRLIKNLTTNTYIYKFTDALTISAAGSVITFTGSNLGMLNTDDLLIQYDLDTSLDTQLVGLNNLLIDMPSDVTPSLPIRQSPQKYNDCSFAQVGSGILTPDFTQIAAGSGMTVSQSAGNLVIATGTTVNAEFVARGVYLANGAQTLKQITTLSQRIANNNFFIELVDIIGDALAYNIVNTTTVDVTKTAHGFTAQNVGQRIDLCALSSVGVPMEGVIASIPDANTIRFTVAGYPASGSGTLSLTGWNKIELLYTGTTATNLNFNTRRRGWQNTANTATINTTASGHLVSVNTEYGISSLSDKTLVAGIALTDRTSWDTNIPTPDVNMYVQIRAKNGTTAPASTTTWTIGMVRLEDYSATQVAISSTRQQSLNNSLPVRVLSAPSTAVTGTVTANIGTGALAAGTNAIGDVGSQYRANATGAASRNHLISAATTNATIVKASAGRLLGWNISNTNAAFRYVKLHNQTTSPTAGAGVVQTIAVPPNSNINYSLEGGVAFTTGIGMTTVTGAADADNTAVGANDLTIDLFFA